MSPSDLEASVTLQPDQSGSGQENTEREVPGAALSKRQGTPWQAPQPLDLKAFIREVPDFPKPGILFYDISTLLRNPEAWQIATARLAQEVLRFRPDSLAGIESRGFLSAAPVAQRLGCGFTMLRKPGKLPGETVSLAYGLEYGTDTLQVQADAVRPGERVVILDDLLATGGTLAASVALLRKVGAEVVGAAVMIELSELGGREKVDIPVASLMTY
ncbi:adenine phosphoribosyltransferase [Oecophyllibacter saccharovorans]|uniref:Adenine phosphoribosyltransferase n=1 Tax=Oecophyllibacter saccharovorans TaxID=2558360 RepID=A0A506URS6_9PROT|nr:adenine phosphoribosyltransferase [Oecophyllibacter saccharovorans]QDH14918.1 adenine phosphoribosyltransferase [Oecophyllibacter saccharovorans]TPW35107.1 adenine phosphoribosyltransferase [Oecophyllibacter saccharovorans]TPW36056.1 adenine phosphoribosyltransferase [Oecophyllibacter saccharovorans]